MKLVKGEVQSKVLVKVSEEIYKGIPKKILEEVQSEVWEGIHGGVGKRVWWQVYNHIKLKLELG